MRWKSSLFPKSIRSRSTSDVAIMHARCFPRIHKKCLDRYSVHSTCTKMHLTAMYLRMCPRRCYVEQTPSNSYFIARKNKPDSGLVCRAEPVPVADYQRLIFVPKYHSTSVLFHGTPRGKYYGTRHLSTNCSALELRFIECGGRGYDR